MSGFWHGANWTFIIWGALHGFYLITAILINNPEEKILNMFKLQGSLVHKLYQISATFILASFAWIFFRANNFSEAIYIVTHLFKDIDISNFNELKLQFRGMGIFISDILICSFLIILMEVYHFFERKEDVWIQLNKKSMWIRWSVYYILLFALLFLAPYSKVNNFIYFQF